MPVRAVRPATRRYWDPAVRRGPGSAADENTGSGVDSRPFRPETGSVAQCRPAGFEYPREVIVKRSLGVMTSRTLRISLVLASLLAIALLLGLLACGGGEEPASTTTTSPSSSTGETTPTDGTTPADGTTPPGETTFTPEDLAQFDGKDGRPAYVAVDGVVYDVSDSSRWRDGRHLTCPLDATAGRDLSEEIEQAPAGMRALLEAMPVVGRMAE